MAAGTSLSLHLFEELEKVVDSRALIRSRIASLAQFLSNPYMLAQERLSAATTKSKGAGTCFSLTFHSDFMHVTHVIHMM